MLKSDRQNVHHATLPRPGELGHLLGLSTVDPRRRCLVSHYPLTDSPDYHYSVGIHTVFVRFLDNGEVRQCSGIWFHSD